MADRPLSALGSGRRQASGGGSGGNSIRDGIIGFGGIGEGSEREEHAVELQFEENHVVTYAHYGYLVSLILTFSSFLLDSNPNTFNHFQSTVSN